MIPATILALGDSTTAGTPEFRSPVEAPPNGEGNVESQYAYWLMRSHPEWRVLNHGVNGERTDQIRVRFARVIGSLSPDVVIVIGGVNDIYQGHPAESAERELDAIFTLARNAVPCVSIVAGSILPFDTATADQNQRMRAVNDWIRDRVAHHRDMIFCDTRRAVAHPKDLDRLIATADGLHPTAEGYRLMAEALAPAILRALDKRGRQ